MHRHRACGYDVACQLGDGKTHMLVIIGTLVLFTAFAFAGLTVSGSPHYPEYWETFEESC